MSISPFASNLGAAADARSENVDASKRDFVGGISPDWEVANARSLRTNWNKLFPYQLIIMRRNADGQWLRSTEGGNILLPPPFTLPIPPQSLTIDMPFASSVEATQGGVVEQNNGAPFRDISLSGTTGVLPLRGATDRPMPSLLGGVFAGAVNSAQNVATGFRNALNTLGVGTVPPNVIPDVAFDLNLSPDTPAYGTGYYQFLLLKRFLEWYANTKTTELGRNLALGFAIWKEKEIYLVTPQKFTVSRSAGRGLHYQYALNFRAWKRIVPKSGAIGSNMLHSTIHMSPNLLSAVSNSLNLARRTLENGKKVLEAARADINNIVFGTLRQCILFTKDVAGIPFTLKDFGEGLYSDFTEPVLEKIGLGTGDLLSGGQIPTPQEIARSLGLPNDTALNPDLANTLKELQDLARDSQKTMVGSGLPVPSRAGNDYADLARFLNKPKVRDLLSEAQVSGLPLRPSTVTKMQDAIDQVRDLRRENFDNFRYQIQGVMADFSESVGVGDPTYAATYGTSVRTPARSTPTDLDWEILGALSDVCQQMDELAASKGINQTDDATPIDYIAGLARASGIAFTTPRSKFLIPFPYGYTLEQLSAQYLGTPDRWIEIATLNGLKYPYVDEVGRQEPLLTNGNGNQVTVSSPEGYYVGQQVWLTGLGVRREKRRITRIDQIGNSVTLLSLSGLSDLDRFTINNNAFIQCFSPETTNSLQFIYIPSDSEAETDWMTKSIPGVDFFDPLVRVGGVDLLIDHSGDLVVSSDGTTRLAVGLTNLIQRVRIAVATPQGSLARHPEFGFGITPGTSTSDITAQQVLEAAKSFIQNEEGFSGVDYAAVKKRGNSLLLSMAVGIAGVGKTVPITVQLR